MVLSMRPISAMACAGQIDRACRALGQVRERLHAAGAPGDFQ
jgi:hypothetical protein